MITLPKSFLPLYLRGVNKKLAHCFFVLASLLKSRRYAVYGLLFLAFHGVV